MDINNATDKRRQREAWFDTLGGDKNKEGRLQAGRCYCSMFNDPSIELNLSISILRDMEREIMQSASREIARGIDEEIMNAYRVDSRFLNLLDTPLSYFPEASS